MVSSFRRKWPTFLKYVAIGAAAFVFSTAPASAQDGKQQQIDALTIRLEKLEQQNQKLMQLLELRKQQSIVPAGMAPSSVNNHPEDVKNVVEKVLKEKEDKKKAEEEQKKKDDAEDGTEVGSLLNMNATWRNGLWFESPDKAFRVHVGGRAQTDLVFLTSDDNLQFAPGGIGKTDDAVAFRRGRLAVEGAFWEVTQFNVEFDFVNTFNAERTGAPLVANTPAPTDFWVQVDKLPWIGSVRIGNQKPMISFEHLTSSRWLNFMERSYGFDAFIGGLDNGFRPGIQAFNNFLDERLLLSAGVFKNNTTVFGWNTGDGEYDLTTRAVFLPIYEDNGRLLLHLALGYSHRDLDDDQARFRARTSLRNGPPTLHTVLSDVRMQSNDGQDVFVPEIAGVCGPFSFQAEYFSTQVIAAQPIGGGPSQTAKFNSWYAEAHYFLTGEHRPYNKKIGCFDRVIPNEPYFFTEGECGTIWGKGAWQLVCRLRPG